MCGIAAVLLYPQERSPDDWREIRAIFSRNLVFNEERGRAATGLAVIRTDGQVTLHKAALPASQFVETAAYTNLLTALDEQTTLLLGHTRRPTKGSPEFEENNHPLQAGTVFGVHNGHIDNDDALFQEYAYPRDGQVDSEIIFRLLEPISPVKLNGSYLPTVCRQLRRLQGQFTFLAGDQRAPNKLLVLKHNNPLCLHFHARWNALIFSSRYIFLRKAFGHAVLTEALPHDQLMLFDATQLPHLQECPAATCDFTA
jgi:glucosamine 6-phosphate synthetase-like amidotransferase/phosphosugar isomerase protein